MTDQTPRIASFKPIVLEGRSRVSLEMIVENLPTTASNVMLMMPDMLDKGLSNPPKPDPNAPSPYPNIELSILNSQRQQIASLFIVEHKEPYTALTLHLPAPDAAEQYMARAEMSRQGKMLDVVEVPFTLDQVDPADG